MKANHFFILLIVLCSAVYSYAQTEVTIHIETSGTLKSELEKEGVTNIYGVKKLVVSGTLNGKDIRLIREMCGRDYDSEPTEGQLTYLDMEKVELATEKEYYMSGRDIKSPGEINSEMFRSTILETIILPLTIKEFDIDVFNGCKNLKHVTLPEGLEVIWNRSFKNCESLEEIVIPSTVSRIIKEVFAGTPLKTVTLPEGIEIINEACFRGCKQLEEVNLPKSLISIYSDAFNGCEKLKQIIIPEKVARIEDAFKGCTSLANVIMESAVPPRLYFGAFDTSVYDTCRIHIPEGSLSAYWQQFAWQEFNFWIEYPTGSAIYTPSSSLPTFDMNNNRLTIIGIPAGESVKVYTASGVPVSGDGKEYLLPGRGVYVVRVGEREYKVVN